MASCDAQNVSLVRIGEYRTGIFDDSAAEIAAYDAATESLLVVNGADATVDRLDLSDPTAPVLLSQISVAAWGSDITSVTVDPEGNLAAAVVADDKTQPGSVVVFSAEGDYLADVEVGALPDMLALSPNGSTLVVANEGEPDDDYLVDPPGTVSIIDVAGGLPGITAAAVSTVDFTAFDGDALPDGVRRFGPGATTAHDLEPEYIAIAADGATAYVTLQENNALAIIDLDAASVTDLVPLGHKDHSEESNALDPSNADGGIAIATHPVLGMFQPDAIATFELSGARYLVTANEGDARDYDGFSEEVRVADLVLDAEAFGDVATLQDDAVLGRLRVTDQLGDPDGDGVYESLHAFGARSISIWSASGELVADTGSAIEEYLAVELPADFNSTNDENGTFDNRSDDKGPEPEGVAVAQIGQTPYAFVTLERIGGVMVFCLADPEAPTIEHYTSARDFAGDPELDTAGDLGPEGVLVIPAEESPNGTMLLVVANEVSGSTAIYEVVAQ